MARTIVKKGDFGSLMLQKIAELESRTGVRLELAQKVLLAETGTVEQILSILTGSPVRVKVMEQKEKAKKITRQSLIMNESNSVLIKARSTVFIHNLPTKVVSQIRRQELGIGTIITIFGVETFRKIVQIGYDSASESVFRKYRIICKKKVAFEITEEIVGAHIMSGLGSIPTTTK